MAMTPPSLSSLDEHNSNIRLLISLLSRVNCSVDRSLDAVATSSLSESFALCRTSSSLIELVTRIIVRDILACKVAEDTA